LIGLVLLLALAVVAIFGPPLVGNPTRQNIVARMTSPNGTYPMGTDEFGRDILSRVVNGARISLLSGIGAVAFGLVLGVLFGTYAGYFGGAAGTGIMAVMDMLLALPAVLLAVSIAAVLGPSLVTASVAIGVVNVPYFARLIRSAILGVRNQEYLQAARAAGARDLRIIRLHLLPNVLSVLVVQATIGIGNAILLVSSLGFLGLGAQPPAPEWGAMLNEAHRFIEDAPYTGIFPGLGIMLTVISFNLAGDGLRDALDPGLR
jgi:peptide/nickel transport system permease protein